MPYQKFPSKRALKKRTRNEHGPRRITPAGRSVFYDLGFDEAEARVLEMRADLMAALRDRIEKKGWTQIEAAEELGITQPRISALMKGAWRDFSADMLLLLATRLGLRPTLKLAA
jgi:predicted XRE-type DNA-binding protein